MRSHDIWEMTQDEIRNKLDTAHAELFNLRFQFSIGQMQSNARLGQVRRDIARLNTILRAKQLTPEPVPSKASPERAKSRAKRVPSEADEAPAEPVKRRRIRRSASEVTEAAAEPAKRQRSKQSTSEADEAPAEPVKRQRSGRSK